MSQRQLALCLCTFRVQLRDYAMRSENCSYLSVKPAVPCADLMQWPGVLLSLCQCVVQICTMLRHLD